MARILTVAAIVMATALPVAADDRQDFIDGLGDVLAGERFCNLTYDKDMVGKLVATQVEASDMAFPRSLKSAVWVYTLQQKDMGPALAVAYCTQIKRLAAQLGFLK